MAGGYDPSTHKEVCTVLDKGMKLTDAGARTGNGADIAFYVGHR
jgi:hypothetical protein